MQLDTGAIQAPPVPMMSYMATAARANDGLAPTTGVSQPTGVVSTGVVSTGVVSTGVLSTGVLSTGVVNLTNEPDADDVPSTIPIPKVEMDDTITDKNNDIIDAVETAQADTQAQPTEYGRRKRS